MSANQTATWCQTCGNSVENGKCACWCHVADALQRYLGRDFDGAADEAARMWDDLDDEDKARVWRADYADDHDVQTYPDMRNFAPADVREADKLAYSHDEDCPNCGRRQWGGPDPYVTCQACGYDLYAEEPQIGRVTRRGSYCTETGVESGTVTHHPLNDF